jgi:hypothetical protein
MKEIKCKRNNNSIDVCFKSYYMFRKFEFNVYIYTHTRTHAHAHAQVHPFII